MSRVVTRSALQLLDNKTNDVHSSETLPSSFLERMTEKDILPEERQNVIKNALALTTKTFISMLRDLLVSDEFTGKKVIVNDTENTEEREMSLFECYTNVDDFIGEIKLCFDEQMNNQFESLITNDIPTRERLLNPKAHSETNQSEVGQDRKNVLKTKIKQTLDDAVEKIDDALKTIETARKKHQVPPLP